MTDADEYFETVGALKVPDDDMSAILTAFKPFASLAKASKSPLERRRLHCIACMNAVVDDQVNDAIDLETEYDNLGRFQYVASQQVEVWLEDSEEVRGFAIDRPMSFYGDLEGYGWKATVAKWKLQKRKIVLMLDVESYD